MITRDAKEYPETISSEIQGGRPIHFLRVLSWVPLLEYGTKLSLTGTWVPAPPLDLTDLREQAGDSELKSERAPQEETSSSLFLRKRFLKRWLFS